MAKSKPDPISRRSFALGAATVATAVFLPGCEVQAQSPSPSQSEAEAMKKLSPGARAEVEMKVAEIFRKYGNRLSEEQKADIRRVMAETQDGLEKMRNFVLANGDQPAMVLQLDSGRKDQ